MGKLREKWRRDHNGLNFNRRRKKLEFGRLQGVGIFVIEVAVVAFLAYGIIRCFGMRMSMAGESMEPTIYSGNEVMLDKLIYKLRDPRANEVVVFLPKGSLNAQTSIKRVIGVPGDRVEIRNGYVYVNGEVFEDRINAENVENPGLAASEIVLGEGEYFLLGDNRNNSEDSRYITVGTINRDEIEGKVWWVASPSNVGLVN